MSAIDRNTLWSTGHDESVEVNQRALIDKVLARYSGEFTVFRELLQNSDDAASKAVEIHFETKAYLERAEGSTFPEEIGMPDIKQPVHQWTFRNNGIIFREEDWSRLKKIAEGNPDEEKIGAFGVGFYSLFSVTEEPFVKSGNQWMGFYWKDKKDQLFARRGNFPETNDTDTYRQWTTFEMGLREAAPMPTAFDFIRFLTSSITFMNHLENVSVWFDGKRLAQLAKDKGVPKELSVPSGLRDVSHGGMMTVRKVKITSLKISAEVLRLVYINGSENKKPSPRNDHRQSKVPTNAGFFAALFSSFNVSAGSSPIPPTPPSLPHAIVEEPDPVAVISSHVVLSVFCGEVEVSLTEKMISELNRSTKKNPPTRMKLELIYTGKDEYEASKKDEEGLFETTGSLFQGLRADLDGTGAARIYIGHATGQTTGLGGHMSGRFIPTVERESIDLVDRTVAVWNKELLYVGGLIARVAYEMELASIRNLWAGASEGINGQNDGPEPDLRDWLQGRCLHALRFFTAHVSTPSPVVSNLLQASFFSSSLDGSFPIISTMGVLDARNVRAFDNTYTGFLKELPVLPSEVTSNAKLMMDALRARGMIKDITFTDVLAELRSRPLSEQEMVECLQWRINLNTEGIRPAYIAELRREFLEVALFTLKDAIAGERVIPLSMIKTVLIPRNATASIPTDGPLPNHTLPFSLSRQLKVDALVSLFGWSELTIPTWLENLVSPAVQAENVETDLTRSPVWAERVLNVLARSWSSISKEHQAQVVSLLKDKTCIPTKFGMKLPGESYFLNANVFPDLSIVTMPNGAAVKGSLEKVLLALGVLQHVDLQLVFHRMIGTGDWGIPDLIRYLVAVQDSLTELEIDRLCETVAFAKEESKDGQNGNPPSSPVAQKPPSTRFRAMDLYEPSNALRELGLPIIAWGANPKWKSSSAEAKFLFRLGLRRYPPLKDLLSLIAGPDLLIREASLKYFMDNLSAKYPNYDPGPFAALAYVPARSSNGDFLMGTPQEVFTERGFAIMGFSVVDSNLPADWVTKLKLPKAPPTSMITHVLEQRPPLDQAIARKWFEVLAGHLSEFKSSELQHLSSVAFIPTGSSMKDPPSQRQQPQLVTPNKCYLEGDSKAQFHSELFTFVEFGPLANSFLMACGVRNEPTVDELARMLVSDPRNFYKLAGGYDSYLVELRNIAVNHRGLSLSTRNQMKNTACLVASRRVARTSTDKRRKRSGEYGNEEDEDQLEHDLLRPDKIAIIDDAAAHMLFGGVFAAPQEDYIEQLYSMLGSPPLSTLIREEYKYSAEVKDSVSALETRRLVLERLPLFLHERTHSKPLVTYSWLNNQDNFIVAEVGKVTLTRILQFGTVRMVKTLEVTATTERRNKGPVHLWIGSGQIDYYEVSNALCKVILGTPKPHDSLLFMTFLSTDLHSLRRRGYNVDRVLRQHLTEQDAKQLRKQELISDTGNIVSNTKRNSQYESINSGHSNGRQSTSPSRTGSGIFSNLRQKFQKPWSPPLPLPTVPTSSSPPHAPSQPPLPPLKPSVSTTSGIPNPMKPYEQIPSWNTEKEVTPHVKIERNVRAAIEGCKAETNAVIRSQAHMTRVKEAVDEGYCDIMGAVDLEVVGTVGQFKVFVSSQGSEDAKAAIGTMHDAIMRFGEIVLLPLIKLYNIPSTSVHIFYDGAGPLIAFNRGGSLFLNLRYYIAWHDSDVQKSDLTQALTSWYFSLAHEIAHNLVHPHNSEHEFYFSTICEEHIIGLAELLRG